MFESAHFWGFDMLLYDVKVFLCLGKKGEMRNRMKKKNDEKEKEIKSERECRERRKEKDEREIERGKKRRTK